MPPVNPLDIKAQLLARAYASCKSGQVAFIDESYVIPKHAGTVSFYYAAAYGRQRACMRRSVRT